MNDATAREPPIPVTEQEVNFEYVSFLDNSINNRAILSEKEKIQREDDEMGGDCVASPTRKRFHSADSCFKSHQYLTRAPSVQKILRNAATADEVVRGRPDTESNCTDRRQPRDLVAQIHSPVRSDKVPFHCNYFMSKSDGRGHDFNGTANDSLAVDASGGIFVDFDEVSDEAIGNANDHPGDKSGTPEIDLGAEAWVCEGDREAGEVRDEPRPKRLRVASTRGPRAVFEQKLATSLELTNPRLRQMIAYARCYRRPGSSWPKPEGKSGKAELAVAMTMVMTALAESEGPARIAIVRDNIDAFPWFILPREKVGTPLDEDKDSEGSQHGSARQVGDSRMTSDDEEEVDRPLRSRGAARSDGSDASDTQSTEWSGSPALNLTQVERLRLHGYRNTPQPAKFDDT